MRPVAPPMSATAWWPQRWNQASTMRQSRLPRCSDWAVGSKPQYTRKGPAAAAAVRPSAPPATSASRPRERSTLSRLDRRSAAASVGPGEGVLPPSRTCRSWAPAPTALRLVRGLWPLKHLH